MMLPWLAASVARADCDGRTLTDAVTRAESAFVDMDETTFRTASSDAQVTLDCLSEVLTPVQVAAYHRVRALGAFLGGDHARATLDFRAVLGTQPGYVLPQEIAPVGHPLRADFEGSKQFADAERFGLPAPAEGWLLVDGQRSAQAPAGRPFLLQWLDDDGVVSLSAWIDVGDPVPRYPQAVAAAPAPAPVPAPVERRGGALTWVGVSTAVVGGGLYGAAFVTRGRYEAAVDAGDEQAIRGMHGLTNGLTGAGVALMGGGAVMTLVGAF
jgi:hypothetical protein